MSQGYGPLLSGRLAGKGPQEQLVYLLRFRPWVLGHHFSTAVGPGQLALDLIGVEQVQRLGQVGLADALAFAGTDALRPAEDVEEVRRERFVRQHDGPIRSMAILGQVAERRRG